MTLYITKDGQKLGPYSLAEAQSLVAAGTLQSTDWAWYEGLSEWIPLSRVPGFDSAPLIPAAAPSMPVPPAGRPVLVWVICLFFFICSPFSLLSLALIPIMASSSMAIPEAQRHYFESQTYFDYGAAILNVVIILTWAVLFFMLKRVSLYVFLASLAWGVFMLIYNIMAKDWLETVGVTGIISMVVAWLFNLLLLYYNWHLWRKGVLR